MGRDESLIRLFATFFRIGLFTIGGGYAMIPLIQRIVVEDRKWVTEEELADLIVVAEGCPGIFAVNLSIFIGYKLRRTAGAFFCTLGTCLPSFLIILAIAFFWSAFRQNVWVDCIFRGIRPAVVALIATPVFQMARTARINRYNVWIPLVATLLIWALHVSPIYIILAAGLWGYAYGRLIKE